MAETCLAHVTIANLMAGNMGVEFLLFGQLCNDLQHIFVCTDTWV